jgi:zinc protease
MASLSAMKSQLDRSLEVYADVIMNPSFPDAELQRLKQQTIAAIQRERATPVSMGIRVLPGLLYGKGHGYGVPLTGSGFEETVGRMTREDMVKFHQTWIAPNNATLIVVGDITLAELRPKLEQLFKGWASRTVPVKNIRTVDQNVAQAVYILDKPGALQSVIFAAHVAVPANNPDEIAIETLNILLGGAFTSRINMNLRENKHWSYGAQSIILGTKAQRPFIVFASVQTDKTKESMMEISAELNGVVGANPPKEDEVTKVKNNRVLELPGIWETNGAVLGALGNLVQYGWPDDYYRTYAGKVAGLSVTEVTEAGKKLLRPDHLTWVVVGDKSKIETGIRELGYGKVQSIDANGNPVP